MTRTVTVDKLVNTLAVDIKYGSEFRDNKLYTSEVSRPGLVLAGFSQGFPHERIQLIGRTEMAYLEQKTDSEKEEIYQALCHNDTPAIVFARDIEIPAKLIPYAQAAGIPILGAKSKTSRVLSNLTNFLEHELAERISKHGVFMEVYGMGVMLTGTSGVGKSETALELIQRGHRLVADDRVELYQMDELTLLGEAPDILQNLIEIRGLGIVDVVSLYGVAAVRSNLQLELIINLVVDDGTVVYDRLGNMEDYEEIFDVKIPRITIPVKTGRSLSVIIESAAMNHRATLMGFDAKETFNRKLRELIDSNREV